MNAPVRMAIAFLVALAFWLQENRVQRSIDHEVASATLADQASEAALI